jgi:hypothetical protein
LNLKIIKITRTKSYEAIDIFGILGIGIDRVATLFLSWKLRRIE